VLGHAGNSELLSSKSGSHWQNEHFHTLRPTNSKILELDLRLICSWGILCSLVTLSLYSTRNLLNHPLLFLCCLEWCDLEPLSSQGRYFTSQRKTIWSGIPFSSPSLLLQGRWSTSSRYQPQWSVPARSPEKAICSRTKKFFSYPQPYRTQWRRR
jgi:hypothetical protein